MKDFDLFLLDFILLLRSLLLKPFEALGDNELEMKIQLLVNESVRLAQNHVAVFSIGFNSRARFVIELPPLRVTLQVVRSHSFLADCEVVATRAACFMVDNADELVLSRRLNRRPNVTVLSQV